MTVSLYSNKRMFPIELSVHTASEQNEQNLTSEIIIFDTT